MPARPHARLRDAPAGGRPGRGHALRGRGPGRRAHRPAGGLTPQTFAVVGANLTGGAAVSTLRDEGFDGRIVLIGEEPHSPYERPPLSKEYLRGEKPFEASFLRPPSWYEDADVDLLLGTRVERVDAASRAVVTADGERIPYHRLLVATGGRNRRLEVPGRDLEGVLELRTVEDADRIRKEATTGRAALIVGAGFVGMEVAASLRRMGLDVEVIEPLDAPLVRAVGSEMGRVMAAIHRDHGVRFRFGQTVERFEGSARVEGAVTDRGERVPCDLVVVGIGIEPAVDVLEGTGARIANGIVVDEHCRTTVPDVFAAGDVADHLHPLFGRRLRVEHWDNALKQGAAAARSMLGHESAFDDPHWFWSEHYDHELQMAGHPEGWDDLVVRGSIEERSFLAFYLRTGVVVAVLGLDRAKDVRRGRKVVAARARPDPRRLRDEDVDVRTLASAS